MIFTWAWLLHWFSFYHPRHGVWVGIHLKVQYQHLYLVLMGPVTEQLEL